MENKNEDIDFQKTENEHKKSLKRKKDELISYINHRLTYWENAEIYFIDNIVKYERNNYVEEFLYPDFITLLKEYENAGFKVKYGSNLCCFMYPSTITLYKK